MSKDKLFTLRYVPCGAPGEQRRRESSPVTKPVARGKVATVTTPVWTVLLTVCRINSRQQFFDSARRRRLIDTSPFRDHNCVYVTPAEVGQARRVTDSESRPTKDGAKIYFCYRRCCFLSRKR